MSFDFYSLPVVNNSESSISLEKKHMTHKAFSPLQGVMLPESLMHKANTAGRVERI